MKKSTEPFRQGDVMCIPSSHPSFKKPQGKLQPIFSSVPARHVLAYGEATGHHHSVDAAVGTLTMDESGTAFLTVDEEIALCEHQEHGVISLPRDVYNVRRQIEWTDENEPRPVVD